MNQELLIKYNFFSTAICDIIKTVEANALTGGYILTFCGIDYMGLALKPELKQNTKIEFKRYISDYMGRLNPGYAVYNEHLYAIRCSLVHSYGPSKATKELDFMPFLIFNEPIRYNHLTMETDNNGDKILNLVLSDLICDFILSVKIFFEENEGRDFSTWLSKLFYTKALKYISNRQEILEKGYFNYGEIHPILSVLDNNRNLNVQKDLLTEILSKIISDNV